MSALLFFLVLNSVFVSEHIQYKEMWYNLDRHFEYFVLQDIIPILSNQYKLFPSEINIRGHFQ